MQEDDLIALPAKEKDAVPQRAKLPNVPDQMLDKGFAQTRAMLRKSRHIGEYLLAVDARVLVLIRYILQSVKVIDDFGFPRSVPVNIKSNMTKILL